MPATSEAIAFANSIVRAAAKMKIDEAIALDVSDRTAFSDVFVIVTCENERLVRATVEHIESDLLEVGVKAHRREGLDGGQWVLLDYGDVMVHVFRGEEREFYALDKLWGDCPRIDMPIFV